MRGVLVLLTFMLVVAGVSYYLLSSQNLLGADGVSMLWTVPAAPPSAPARDQVDPTPLQAMLREEVAAVEESKANLERERGQYAVELAVLEEQREQMADELEAVRRYREELSQQRTQNVASLSRMISNMDAGAAAQIVEKLPEKLAVSILLNTKQRESGAILEEMDPNMAAVLSERIARANLPES